MPAWPKFPFETLDPVRRASHKTIILRAPTCKQGRWRDFSKILSVDYLLCLSGLLGIAKDSLENRRTVEQFRLLSMFIL